MYENKFQLVIQRLLFEDISYIQKVQLRGVTAEWFSEESYRYLVGFVYTYYNDYHKVINREIILDYLKNVNASEFIVNTYISLYDLIIKEIVDVDNIKENFDFYFELFKQDKIKRDFNVLLQTTINKIKDNNYETAINTVKEGLLQIDNLNRAESVGYTLKEIAEDRVASYHYRKNHPEENIGIKSGIRLFDTAMNGFRPEDLCIVVARSGIGKSILLTVVAKNMFVLDKRNVMYGSIEIGKDMSDLRLESSITDLPFDFIRDGRLSDEEEYIFTEIYNCIRQRDNEFYNMPSDQCKTPDGIRSEIHKFKTKYGKNPDSLFVDYVNIMSLDARYGNIIKDNEKKRIIIEELKQIGRDESLNIWTASQQTRSSKTLQATNKNYDISTEALSDSDYLGNTADFITLLSETKEDEENGTMSVDNIKVRFGGKNKFKLKKNFRKMYIGDSDDDEMDMGDD